MQQGVFYWTVNDFNRDSRTGKSLIKTLIGVFRQGTKMIHAIGFVSQTRVKV